MHDPSPTTQHEAAWPDTEHPPTSLLELPKPGRFARVARLFVKPFRALAPSVSPPGKRAGSEGPETPRWSIRFYW